MGDLATEIEQMQAEINAFDDKLDALDANGEEGRKEEESPKKSIFSRLGSSGNGGKTEGNQSEEEEDSPKKRKSSMKSAVIDTTRRRESDISKDDITKAQMGNEAGKRRASRMFGMLLGTLRSFDDKAKTEGTTAKRAEIDRRVDEKVAADRRKIMEEKRALLIKKREKEKLLQLLQSKKDFADLRVEWEDQAMERTKYIRTATTPVIYWKPRILDPDTKELQKKSKQKVLDLLEESKEKWDETKKEMIAEIADIKERNQFKDIELRVETGNRRPSIGQRLVITKSVKNDQRIVQPKTANGDVRTIEKPSEKCIDENGGRKSKEERKQKEKERRKEIENARKRRHKSDSESEEEYQERQRKSKKEKVEDKSAIKDVRRVAPKESQAAEQSSKSDTNIIPNPSRRISLKTSAKKMDSTYGEEDSKRRRQTKKPDPASAKQKNSSSSSSSSSESDSCNRTPSKSG